MDAGTRAPRARDGRPPADRIAMARDAEGHGERGHGGVRGDGPGSAAPARTLRRRGQGIQPEGGAPVRAAVRARGRRRNARRAVGRDHEAGMRRNGLRVSLRGGVPEDHPQGPRRDEGVDREAALSRSRVPDELARVLIHIQSRLDGDLSLRTLARVSHVSPFHFHRKFRALVGETVKGYVQRVRLERAAIRLLLHRESVWGVALDAGFRNHETFCRAFKKRFGVSPRSYRRRATDAKRAGESNGSHAIEESGRTFKLSKTRVVEVAETHLACLRHVGPYEHVPPGLWDRLTVWAGRSGVPGPLVLFGIAHDAPGITAPDRLRFDAGVRIPRPMALRGAIACQTLSAGPFSLTTHLGHFRTLARAYRTLVARLKRLAGYDVLGLPAVEVYRTTKIDSESEINETD